MSIAMQRPHAPRPEGIANRDVPFAHTRFVRNVVIAFSLAMAIPTRSSGAQTQVIGFESLPASTSGPGGGAVSVPTGYAGLTWSTAVGLGFHEWNIFNASSGAAGWWRPASGAENAASDDESDLWFSRPGNPFNFNSIFLSELFISTDPQKDYPIFIQGFLNGQQAYSTTIQLSQTAMTKYDMDWSNIDEVKFGAIYGRLVVDDISLTTTPEPASVILTATGLAALLLFRRRRRSTM